MEQLLRTRYIDAELNTDSYKIKCDPNTVLSYSIILNDKRMLTSLLIMMHPLPKIYKQKRTQQHWIPQQNSQLFWQKEKFKNSNWFIKENKGQTRPFFSLNRESPRIIYKALNKGLIKGRSIKEMIESSVCSKYLIYELIIKYFCRLKTNFLL